MSAVSEGGVKSWCLGRRWWWYGKRCESREGWVITFHLAERRDGFLDLWCECHGGEDCKGAGLHAN